MIQHPIAAAAILAALPIPAMAEQAPRTRTVHTADLDLSSTAGQRKLDRRIASATQAVCGSYAGAPEHALDGIKACRAAVAEQVRPALAAISPRRVAAR